MAAMVAACVANPLFSMLVSSVGARRVMPIVHRLCTLVYLVFYALIRRARALDLTEHLAHHEHVTAVYHSFFLFIGVANLLLVSMYWTAVTDYFSAAQAKRLFGVISAGGTVGQLVGAGIAGTLSHSIGSDNLILVCAVAVEAAVHLCARLRQSLPGSESVTDHEAQLHTADHPKAHGQGEPHVRSAPLLRTALSGITALASSGYLLAVCMELFCTNFVATLLYFQRGAIVHASYSHADADGRVAFFGKISFLTSAATLALQVTATGPMLSRLGLSVCLLAGPIVSAVGFLLLGVLVYRGDATLAADSDNRPSHMSLMLACAVFEISKRCVNYAITRPSREVLFTAVETTLKLKTKALIDTVVHRGGNGIASGIIRLAQLGVLPLLCGAEASRAASGPLWSCFNVTGPSIIGVPVAVLWGLVARRLALWHQQIEQRAE